MCHGLGYRLDDRLALDRDAIATLAGGSLPLVERDRADIEAATDTLRACPRPDRGLCTPRPPPTAWTFAATTLAVRRHERGRPRGRWGPIQSARPELPEYN